MRPLCGFDAQMGSAGKSSNAATGLSGPILGICKNLCRGIHSKISSRYGPLTSPDLLLLSCYDVCRMSVKSSNKYYLLVVAYQWQSGHRNRKKSEKTFVPLHICATAHLRTILWVVLVCATAHLSRAIGSCTFVPLHIHAYYLSSCTFVLARVLQRKSTMKLLTY